MPSIFDDLAQPGIDTLNGIGGVDNTPDMCREGEERNYLVPVASPGCRYGWELGTLGAVSNASNSARAASALAAV